jgi:hypothetical protein
MNNQQAAFAKALGLGKSRPESGSAFRARGRDAQFYAPIAGGSDCLSEQFEAFAQIMRGTIHHPV